MAACERCAILAARVRLLEARIRVHDCDLRDERRRASALETRLRAIGDEPPEPVPEWSRGLTPAAAAMVAELLRSFPHYRTRAYLERTIPKRDHAKDRDDRIVEVYVTAVRKLFGRASIEKLGARGYRCSAEFHAQHGRPTAATELGASHDR